MLAILLFSTVAFVLMGNNGDNRTVEYNDHKLHDMGEFWKLKYNNQDLLFRLFPSALDHINISNEAINSLNETNYVFFSFNPEDQFIEYVELIRLEFEKEMKEYFNKDVLSGILKNSTIYKNPVIDCNNATNTTPVVIFKTGNETKFNYENNCITATANQARDLIILKERLFYGMVGVIE